MNPEELAQEIQTLGAFRTGTAAVKDITFDRGFRALCEQNACGNYGKSWMCPPDAGDIDTLIARAKSYEIAVVYQTVGMLEDSYDFEGMMAAGQRMNELTLAIRRRFGDQLHEALFLGAGGCRVCPVCAKKTGEPCRFPEQALASLETYGIHVSRLAELCGMKYINGQNTVTYFGAILLRASTAKGA
ncbi:MAG: DUF2284 domain-containing protein [Acutalibacteraceae bacterium]